ncbi:MAG: PHP domain-containing protein [Gammaproteobacteria bacterium]|jgi:predicted metal-dependent phosphoesterase TrpH|nr:PHP domain-containing protein [Gammaproteobacteria bacterium]
MSLIYDLHSHSTASDGSLRPKALLARAKSQNIDVLALTDHDNTAGLEEAEAAAGDLGVKLVPGVEISVTWNKTTVHVLGLGIRPQNDALQSGLRHLREFRNWRGEEISRRLAKAGIDGALDGAKQYASGALISRTHFAHFLVAQGHAKDLRDVFKKYLVHNKPGHVPGQWADLASAVGWIHEAGGIAVIAHPVRYKLSATRLRQLLGEFKECGGKGLEVVSSSHSLDECQAMAIQAKNFGFYATRGSDYHGPEHTWVELGKIPPLPAGCNPIWSQWNL